MKKLSITALALLGLYFGANASDFIGKINGIEYEFDWVDKNKTRCQFAEGKGFSVEAGEAMGNDPTDNNAWKPMPTVVLKSTGDLRKGPNANKSFPSIPKSIDIEIDGETKTVDIVGIGAYSFATMDEWQGLSNATFKIPSTIEFIGTGAFFLAGNSGNISIADGVERIGDYAFARVTGNGDIEIPSSVTYLGKGAFYKTSNYKNITINCSCSISDEAFYFLKQGVNVIIGDNVTGISASAFEGVNEMETLEIGEGVKKIEPGTFAYKNLKSVKLGKNLKEIGANAFAFCTNLNNLNLSECEKLETIGDSAFEKCNLEFVMNFPPSLRTIGNSAFKGSRVKGLVFPKDSELKTISDSAFENCSAMEGHLDFPDSLLWIGDDAFNNCSGVSGISFGSKLTHIGDYAFYRNRCLDYASIHLPGTLEYLGARAFDFIRTAAGTHEKPEGDWMDLYVYNPVPPTTGDVYLENDVWNGPFGGYIENVDYYNTDHYWIYPYVCLHVPYGTLDKYKNAKGWMYFSCIIDDIINDDVQLNSIVGYTFIRPGDEINVVKDVIRQASYKSTNLDWAYEKDKEWGEWSILKKNGNDSFEIANESEILEVKANGDVDGKKFGQEVVIATRRADTDSRYDGNGMVNVEGNYVEINGEKRIITGAVIVFVCPTITVVYGNEEANDEKPAVYKAGALDGGESTATTLDDLTKSYITYEHIVAYNSLPKLDITSAVPEVIELGTIKNAPGGLDEERTPKDVEIEVKSLDDILKEIQNDNITLEDEKIVPIDPIADNRVIYVAADPQKETWTSVEAVIENTNIRIKTSGKIISIEGAEPEDVFTIVNVDGMVIYSGTNKTVEMPGRGIYAGKIGDKAFKITVR